MPDNTDATGITTVATSYDEAVRSVAGRRAATDWPGTPVPDTPTGAIHLNPALTPAPIRKEIPERIPVPVINDPGVVGANPDLGLLNRSARADTLGVSIDKLPPTEVGLVTVDTIKDAALGTQAMIGERIDDQVGKTVDASQSRPVPVTDDAGESAPQSPKKTDKK